MPPDPLNENSEIEAPGLSDTDVALLHQIVLRAQTAPESHSRPKKVLYEAYEHVFADNGLDTRLDRACLRILLQLGDPQVPGTSLYDKFEHILRQIGVKVSFKDDETDADEDSGGQGENERAERARAPRRRASFTSMLDVTNELGRAARPRRFSGGSDSQIVAEYPRALPRPQNAVSAQPAQLNSRRRANRHRITHGEDDLSAAGPSSAYDAGDHSSAQERARAILQRFLPMLEQNAAPEPELEPARYRPQPGESHDLEADAEAFNDIRLRNHSRLVLRQLLHHAKESLSNIRSQQAEAEERDSFTLKRQALDFWRSAAQQRSHLRTEERFFGHLYNRAGRAYDLFLFTKAFTHWAQIAASAAAQNKAARERFLFGKYFHAWHDFTVSNELKAERQALKSPLAIIRRRAVEHYQDEVKALEFYHNNLTKVIFWRWFREWVDRAAPRYQEQQLQKYTLKKWARITRDIRTREKNVVDDRIRSSLRQIFTTWGEKAKIDVAGHRQAEAFRRSHLLGPILNDLTAEARLKPLEDRLTRIQDWKAVRLTFVRWQLRTRMIFRADAVSRAHVTQNSFSAWNEHLRCNAVGDRIDDRILAEGMYRWVITERCLLMQRVCWQNQKKRIFGKFVEGVRQRRDDFAAREEVFVRAHKEYLVESSWNSWRQNLSKIHESRQTAMNFHEPRLKADVFAAIKMESDEKEKRDRWATDARFYFIMTKTINMWRKAAAQRKNDRERANHARMRRTCKINLARRLLHGWHDKQLAITAASEQADAQLNRRLIQVRNKSFTTWHSSAAHLQTSLSHASGIYTTHLQTHCLASLSQTSTHLSDLSMRATRFQDLTMSDLCSTYLRRLSLRAFEMRRRNQDADAMRERHGAKHVRSILRHWGGRQKRVLYNELVDQPLNRDENHDAERDGDREDDDNRAPTTDTGYATQSNEDQTQPNSFSNPDLRSTRRAENWSTFDTSLLGPSSPTLLGTTAAAHNFNDTYNDHQEDEEPAPSSIPAPARGYLATPSKREVRARAMADLSTTPRGTPLRTPFAARLRFGAPGGNRSVARRSRLGDEQDRQASE